jgi:ABC-type branched-subunit amino acid transport system ATPase component
LARPDAIEGIAAPADPLLAIEDLWVSYRTLAAVKGVRLAIAPGEVVALLGANGAGKSTLLRTVSGLNRPRSCHVRFAGQAIDRAWPRPVSCASASPIARREGASSAA